MSDELNDHIEQRRQHAGAKRLVKLCGNCGKPKWKHYAPIDPKCREFFSK